MAIAFGAIALAVAIVALAGAAVAFARATGGPTLVGRTVVIHTTRPDDRTIRGVLHGQYADRWVLRDAIAIEAGGTEVPLGGVEHVLVGQIAFAQEIEA